MQIVQRSTAARGKIAHKVLARKAIAPAIIVVAMIVPAMMGNVMTARKLIAAAMVIVRPTTAARHKLTVPKLLVTMKGAAKALVIATANKFAIVKAHLADKRAWKGQIRTLVPRAMATKALATSLDQHVVQIGDPEAVASRLVLVGRAHVAAAMSGAAARTLSQGVAVANALF